MKTKGAGKRFQGSKERGAIGGASGTFDAVLPASPEAKAVGLKETKPTKEAGLEPASAGFALSARCLSGGRRRRGLAGCTNWRIARTSTENRGANSEWRGANRKTIASCFSLVASWSLDPWPSSGGSRCPGAVTERAQVRLPGRRLGCLRRWSNGLRRRTLSHGAAGRPNLLRPGAALVVVGLEIDRLLLIESIEPAIQDGRAMEEALLPGGIHQEAVTLRLIESHNRSAGRSARCRLAPGVRRPSRSHAAHHLDRPGHFRGATAIHYWAFPFGCAPLGGAIVIVVSVYHVYSSSIVGSRRCVWVEIDERKSVSRSAGALSPSTPTGLR